MHIDGEHSFFGPEKSVPVCYIGEKYHDFIEEVKRYAGAGKTVLNGFLPFEGMILSDTSAIERNGAYGKK